MVRGTLTAQTVTMTPRERKQALADLAAEFSDDWLGLVMALFPWDSDPSIQMVKLAPEYRERFGCEFGPDKWACEFLDEVSAEIKKRGFDMTKAVAPLRFSTSSGHGIGKSCLVAWIILCVMITRPFCKGTVTAMTEPQLRARTWAELGKWYKRSILTGLFQYNTGRGAMRFYQVDHDEEWFFQAVTCREENSEAFAGQHAANSTSCYIFDECSNIAESIWKVREGGLTDGEPMTFDFGNPTRNSGRFYENMVGKFKHRFIKRFIDSRDVHITNKPYWNQFVEDHGEESDEVKIRVRGLFPSLGALQFIGTSDVMQCMSGPDIEDRYAPLVIGVDMARYGDDEIVVYPRIGRDARTYEPIRTHEPDTIVIANKIIAMVQMFRNRGVEYGEIFIDSTGGYGGGVADQLRNAGYHCVEINFGWKSPDKKFRYMSDYMWGKVKEAIKSGLRLPKMGDRIGEASIISAHDLNAESSLIPNTLAKDLFDQLTSREFTYTLAGNMVHLEPKKDMKERTGVSPDLADALALTYAMPVENKNSPRGVQTHQRFSKFEYDPYG